MPRTGSILLLVLLLSSSLFAATNVDVGSTVVVPQVKRFGISGISHYYYDRLLLKNLVWRNAGFEPLLFQVVMRCNSAVTATGCIDSNPFTQWPTGFWNGGTYEFILGTVKGRSGTIASSTAPPADRSYGTTWTFADSGVAPAVGDSFIARKMFPGGAEAGWSLSALGGASVSTETADQPPNTEGRQCLRVSASGQGQSMQVSTAFGAFPPNTFLVLNGTYRISFKAKKVDGTNSNLGVSVSRGGTITSQLVTLTSSWSTYSVDFTAAETNPQGYAVLSFNVSNAAVLLDDVSLVQTNTDPTNPTAFRDPVVAALRAFNPGSLRGHVLDLGQSIDDLVAPPFARLRTEFHASATNKTTNQYGWPELLELCQHLGSEPYLVLPIAVTETEVQNAIEYLAGPATSPYGARRAAHGRTAPWTDAFPRIHIEYGNESWNPVYLGATLYPADYGRRGNDLYAAIRQSPHFTASKFNLILGVQSSNPFNTRTTHNASASHDTLAIAPYMATQVDDYATNEQLFGSLFAEASWWSKSSNGFVKQTYDIVNATTRPVPFIVYEVNLHTTRGTIPQEVLDSFAPSTGAGLAVANHMLNMLREQQIRDQLLFSLGGYRYSRDDGKTVFLWGIDRDFGVTGRKRPQYHAIKLLNEALSGDLVQTTHTGDNPMWNQPLTNRIAMDNVPYIQSFAFAGGGRRSMVVFNLHRTSALEVTFSGANAPGGTVTMKRFTSANLTDTNENADVVAVTTQQLANFNPSQPLSLPPFSMTVLIADPLAPSNLVATATSTTSVALTWTAAPGATSYTVHRSTNGTVSTEIGTASSTSYTDSTASPGTAYLYRVRALDRDSNPDLATTVLFTEVTPEIRAVHFEELRSAVNAVRALAGGNAFPFNDSSLVAGLIVKAAHLTELRAVVDAARSALGLPSASYTDPAILERASVIRRQHIADLQAAVR